MRQKLRVWLKLSCSSIFGFPFKSHCDAVRRQKEQELEVLCGSVRNWEGDEPSKLGELIYMGPVKILPSPSSPEVKDRHLVLFSQCIVFLSVNQQLSAFVFEVRSCHVFSIDRYTYLPIS